MKLSSLPSADSGRYRFRVKVTDRKGNEFKNKHPISLTKDGQINLDSLAKERTSFIYLFRNGQSVSYGETDSGNPTTSDPDNETKSDHDSDHSVPSDDEHTYWFQCQKLNKTFFIAFFNSFISSTSNKRQE